MVLVVDDAELAWRHPVNLLFGVYHKGALVFQFEGSWVVFGGVANFKGDIDH